MTRKVIKGYITIDDAEREHEGIKAIVWEAPFYDERIPCTLTFTIPDEVEPDIDAALEERRRPTYREQALMDGGNTHIAEPFRDVLNKL